MKLKEILNIKNIANFIEGHARYFYNKLIGLSEHEQEQIMWRLDKCKDDCIPDKSCKYCTCPPEKKVFQKESCNKGERFPDMMGRHEWEKYKEDNGISRS